MLVAVAVALGLAADFGVVILDDGRDGRDGHDGRSGRSLTSDDVFGVDDADGSADDVDAILARIDAAVAPKGANARAVELVRRGEELLLSFDHARAAAALGEAAALLEPTLSDVDFDTWTRARTLAGVAWMEAGNADAAKDAFTRLLALHPDVVPDASLLSPAARAAFDAARADVSARGTGTLEVRSGAIQGASIVVDGRPRGKAPLSIAGLVAGTHRVHVSAPGYESAAADVRVDANAIVPHDVTLAATRQRRLLETLTADVAPATVLAELRGVVADATLDALFIVHVDADVVRVRRVTSHDGAPVGVHVAREPQGTLRSRVRDAFARASSSDGIDWDATLLGRARTKTAVAVAPPVEPETDWLLIGGIGGGSLLVVAAAAVAVVALWPQPVPERTLAVALELPAP